MATYLSGIQPTGMPHLGNYFGAMRQHLALARSEGEHFYFIADYHALTSVHEPDVLRAQVLEVAASYMALGLDERALLFRQSDVPEVTELTWLLCTVTGMGLLERAHSYKDKVAHGAKPSMGLFTYPLLMAADILAYDTDFVPVGKDQLQHVEITQDVAGSFNARFGQVFARPEPRLPQEGDLFAKVPGVDGDKMSKSYGNGLWIFESGKKLKKIVGRILTDSREPEEPKDPSSILLFDFLRLFLDDPEIADWEARVREGGAGAPGYGHLKVRLIEAIDATFGPARARREELLADRGELLDRLSRGAEVARERAQQTTDRALRACGIRG